MKADEKHTFQFPIGLLYTILSIFNHTETIIKRRADIIGIVMRAYYDGAPNLYSRLLGFTNRDKYAKVLCDSEAEFDYGELKEVRIPFDTAFNAALSDELRWTSDTYHAYRKKKDAGAIVDVMLTKEEVQITRDIFLKFWKYNHGVIFRFILAALNERTSKDWAQIDREYRDYFTFNYETNYTKFSEACDLVFSSMDSQHG